MSGTCPFKKKYRQSNGEVPEHDFCMAFSWDFHKFSFLFSLSLSSGPGCCIASNSPGWDTTQMEIWMFPKIVGFSPQIIHFNRVFHYFHHPFWGKHPYFWFKTPIPLPYVMSLGSMEIFLKWSIPWPHRKAHIAPISG